MLRRLAQDTGGRFTRNTNDLSLAYARARRDQACRYTLGFYLSSIEEDRPRHIRVRVLRDGLRGLTPTQYLYRSESEERTHEILAAYMMPDAYQTGYVRAHVFPLHPLDRETWSTLVAVSFPFHFDDSGKAVQIEFGAMLQKGGRAVHEFDRRMTLKLAENVAPGKRRFMFLEPLDLAPGEYRLTVVMAHADGVRRPDATRLTLAVPSIPRKSVMLVQPILGRPRDENVLVRGDGPTKGRKHLDSNLLAQRDIVAGAGAFEPFMVQLMDDEEEVHARNKACLVGGKRQPGGTGVSRQVAEDDGWNWRLPIVRLELAVQTGNPKVLCQNLYELVPDEAIEPGESYEFRATVEPTPKIETVREEIPFAVVSGDDED